MKYIITAVVFVLVLLGFAPAAQAATTGQVGNVSVAYSDICQSGQGNNRSLQQSVDLTNNGPGTEWVQLEDGSVYGLLVGATTTVDRTIPVANSTKSITRSILTYIAVNDFEQFTFDVRKNVLPAC